MAPQFMQRAAARLDHHREGAALPPVAAADSGFGPVFRSVGTRFAPSGTTARMYCLQTSRDIDISGKARRTDLAIAI